MLLEMVRENTPKTVPGALTSKWTFLLGSPQRERTLRDYTDSAKDIFFLLQKGFHFQEKQDIHYSFGIG